MPAIKPSKPVGLPKDNIAPHEQEAQGMPVNMNYVPGVDIGRTGSVLPGQDVDPTLGDPNAGYQTGIQPMEPNAYLHHGELTSGPRHDPQRFVDRHRVGEAQNW